MKIAIIHNFMDNIGGAEKVGLVLARELTADLYTTNTNPNMIAKMGFEQDLYSIGKIPTQAPFKQQFASLRFRAHNIKKTYDCYIIDGDWAVSAAVKNKPNIWYVHSPIREIWDLYPYTRKHLVPWLLRPIFDIWVLVNRYLNRTYVQHVNTIVCNSENVKQRVKKYLGKDAIVIHPPTDTKKFFYKTNGNFWLSVNRLTTHKRISLQLKAFANLPRERLIIVGSYEKTGHFLAEKKRLEKILPPNVTILHHVDDKKLKELYATCKGFITTSKNEDFGLTPIEAMASGKPVIAPAEGGYLETIIDKKTGVLIENITVDKLITAIKHVGKNPSAYRHACEIQAKKFDTSVFIAKMKAEIEKVTAQTSVEQQAIQAYNQQGKVFAHYLDEKKPQVSANTYIERPNMIKLVNKNKGEKLLDVGCGSGLHLQAYTTKETKVTGIEPSLTLLHLARKKNKNLQLLQATAQHIPFADETFDTITASMVLLHVDHLQEALREIARVLKKEGLFFFSDYNDLFSAMEKENKTKNSNILLGGVLNKEKKELRMFGDFFKEEKRTTEFIPGMVLPYYRRTTKTYLQALQKTGFELIDITYCKPTQKLRATNKKAFAFYSKVPQITIYMAKRK